MKTSSLSIVLNDDVGDDHEIEWLELLVMSASVLHIYWRSEQMAHLLQSPSADTDPKYMTWLTGNYSVMTWLLNSLEKKINGSVKFLTSAKEMWDTLKVMYGNEKNPLKSVWDL